MPGTDDAPKSPDASAGARSYAWPKYVLAAVSCFFCICILWTIKEVTWLRRVKQDGQEMRGGAPSVVSVTNSVPPTNAAPAR